jgi:hypothetical protein
VPTVRSALTMSAAVLLLAAFGLVSGAGAQAGAGGTIVITGAVDGAEVYVDGELVGQAPLEPIDAAPGSHTVRVTRAGYTEFTDVVRVRKGKATKFPVEMIAVSMVLSLRSEPEGAQVFVDENFAGEAPLELDLLEGIHKLKLSKFNYRDLEKQIDARAGVRETLSLTLELLPAAEQKSLEPEPQDSWYQKPTTWLLIGGAAAIVATTVVLLVVFTQSDPSKVDSFCARAEDCVRVP